MIVVTIFTFLLGFACFRLLFPPFYLAQKVFFSTSSTSSRDVHLIINAVGKERLGIVSDVTGLVTQAGGNVCDSQAARLGPYFSLIMGVTISESARESLSAKLGALPGMQAVVYEDDQAMEMILPQAGCKYVAWVLLCFCDHDLKPHVFVVHLYLAFFIKTQKYIDIHIDTGHFTLSGADNPGIVHKITTTLASHGLSIDQMSTDQEIAPHGGSVLFQMEATVTAGAPLAAGFDVSKIRADLVNLGESLNCDVSLEDVE
jgi:glycine cleavage system transcriptional repressor